MFVDIHAHHASLAGGEVLQQNVHNLGIHPWDITTENAEQLIVDFERRIVDNRFISIGECGLDKLCSVPLDLQERMFRFQVMHSERLSLPLIIHCVKAQEEILRIRKEMKPRQPWIFHGFRGKSQQACQLIKQGLYISFGLKHNAEALRTCPPNRLFLETDDQEISVSIIYNKVAEELEMPLSKLENVIQDNFMRVFPCNVLDDSLTLCQNKDYASRH